MLASLSCTVAHWVGRPAALVVTLAATALSLGGWVVSGYREPVLTGINLTISVVSLLLLVMLQGSQNRDGLAIQAKLDELVAAMEGADNKLIKADEKSEDEIEAMRRNGF